MNQTDGMDRRNFLRVAGGTALAGFLGGAGAAQPKKPRNILFIAVDDLRPTLGCYGDPLVRSPHIDKLAARGVVFTRAYCQQAVCSPSRNGVLTGKRPDTLGIYDLPTHLRSVHPDILTLPQHFKNHGYHTERLGKIFHIGHGNYDDRQSWTVSPGPFGPRRRPAGEEDPWEETALDEWIAANCQPPNRANATNLKTEPPFGAPDVPDDQLTDGKMADAAIKRLEEFARVKQPFFLATGFAKPHLPFVAPKKYWDMYKRESFSLEPIQSLPKGSPPYVGNNSGELRAYQTVPQQGAIPDDMARQLIHGYYAATSYMDAQVGRLLDALDRLKLRDNTAIILWGDHGWHLGDHGMWCKHTNFERATSAPLIVSAPATTSVGKKCSTLCEFVDIFPTVCDLAELPKPADLEGVSLTPYLNDTTLPGKKAVFHQWPKKQQGKDGMGHSIRTERYRLTEWTFGKDPSLTATELFDYQNDPLERENLAGKPENKKTVEELRDRLHAGWKPELPPAPQPAAPPVVTPIPKEP